MALVSGGNVGKVALRLLEDAGERLAAIAFKLVVGAEVEGVDVGAVGFEGAPESRAEWFQHLSAE